MATAAISAVSLFQPQTAPKTVFLGHPTFRLSTRLHLASLRRRGLRPVLAPTVLPKCLGSDGGGEYEHDGTVYPRPVVIPWSNELANTVQLIGTVGAPVQIQHLKIGKVVATTCLGIKKSATETTWITLSLWGELAFVAFQHVEKGQKIYVSGRFICETVERERGKRQVFYKVVVQRLNFIERNSPPASLYTSNSDSMPKSRRKSNYAGNRNGFIEELWQAFFANPSEWWDNRKNKRTSKSPDFKHKDTGEALWLEGRYNPPWVKSQLEILDSRKRAVQENELNNSSISGLSNEGFTNF